MWQTRQNLYLRLHSDATHTTNVNIISVIKTFDVKSLNHVKNNTHMACVGCSCLLGFSRFLWLISFDGKVEKLDHGSTTLTLVVSTLQTQLQH